MPPPREPASPPRLELLVRWNPPRLAVVQPLTWGAAAAAATWWSSLEALAGRAPVPSPAAPRGSCTCSPPHPPHHPHHLHHLYPGWGGLGPPPHPPSHPPQVPPQVPPPRRLFRRSRSSRFRELQGAAAGATLAYAVCDRRRRVAEGASVVPAARLSVGACFWSTACLKQCQNARRLVDPGSRHGRSRL